MCVYPHLRVRICTPTAMSVHQHIVPEVDIRCLSKALTFKFFYLCYLCYLICLFHECECMYIPAYMCLFPTCTWCLWRSEKDITESGTGVTHSVSCYMGGGM